MQYPLISQVEPNLREESRYRATSNPISYFTCPSPSKCAGQCQSNHNIFDDLRDSLSVSSSISEGEEQFSLIEQLDGNTSFASYLGPLENFSHHIPVIISFRPEKPNQSEKRTRFLKTVRRNNKENKIHR